MREKYLKKLSAVEKELLEVLTNQVISDFYLTPESDCVLTHHEFGKDIKFELRTTVGAIEDLTEKMSEIDRVTSSVTKIYHNGQRLLEIFERHAQLQHDGFYDFFGNA